MASNITDAMISGPDGGETTRNNVGRPPFRRYKILGIEFTDLHCQDAVELIEESIEKHDHGTRRIYLANAHTLNLAAKDPAFHEILNGADYVFGDGTGVRWAARTRGIRVRDNLVGTDLIPQLLDQKAGKGYSYFLLGGKPDAIATAAAFAEERFPGWKQCGYHHGYLTTPEINAQAIEEINSARPDLLLVGMGNPTQETWLHRYQDQIKVPVSVAVGGLFSYWQDDLIRAPLWLRKAGHEWIWILCQQPHRKTIRYLVGNPLFLGRIARERLAQQWHRLRTNSAERTPTPIELPVPPADGTDRPRVPVNVSQNDVNKRLSISVVVPCFDEAECVDQLAECLALLSDVTKRLYDLEFVLVDDGSRDNTWDRLCETFGDEPGYRLVRHSQNRGIAAAIMTGVKAADTEIVCSIDADCTYDPAQLREMIPQLSDDVGMVTASPYHPLGAVRDVAPWRLKLSRMASAMYGSLLDHKLFCYTSCFRVYRRSAVQDIELQCPGFVGVAELLWKVEANGHRIKEVPAILTARTVGASKLSVFKATLGHLALMNRMLVARLRNRRKAATEMAGPPTESSKPTFADEEQGQKSA